MPTVAERLREAREAQRLTVHDVAEVTKIKTDHIRALESGEYKFFSAPVYIRGFVRTYASILKLDVPEIIAVLDAELAQTQQFRDPPSLIAPQQSVLDKLMFYLSKLSWPMALGIGLVLAVLIMATWAVRSWRSRHAQDPLTKLGPGLYQPADTNSGELLPLPTNAVRR
jgi:cytoskeleton protein RodZ